MSFPRYPEYKDSSIEWLGEVPAHWAISALSRVLKCPVTDGPHSTPEFVDEGVPFLSVDGIQDGELFFDSCRYISTEDHEEFSKKASPRLADILMGKAASVGKIARVKTDVEFSIWSPLALIRVDRLKAVPEFCEYALKSEESQYQISQKSNSNTQLNIGMKDIPKLRVCFPPLDEQNLIAAFLDHETARIDALVEEQQRLIELLKEKRQAVISHAVTKGLNPDVPMMDSGVEWLGDVPAHWMVGPLRWYATIQGGVAKGKNYDAGTSTIHLPYLRVANVQDGYVDLSSVNTVTVAVSEVDRYRLQSGDVLMNEGGDNDKLGRGTVWEGEIADCLHQNHVFAIRPNQHLLPHWLSVFTSSNAARSYFYLYSKQSTNLASISSSNVMSCPLPLPPREEQHRILDFLGRETARIDNLMAEGEKVISFLQERRSALISAAVTGKIDVRDCQADQQPELLGAAEAQATYG